MNWYETVMEGRPFEGVYIFDCHGHIDRDIHIWQGSVNADAIVPALDRVGVDAVCVSSILSFTSDWRLGNENTSAAAKKYPGRIYGYAVPTPFDPNCDLRPYFEDREGFLGVKVHGSMQGGTALDDPRYFPAYELAAEKGVPVLFHTWTAEEIRSAENVAARYPAVPVILGHSGFVAPADRAMAIEACRRRDNLFFDTCISFTYDGSLEALVNAIGSRRILYGSDINFYDNAFGLGRLALSRLTDEEKECILGKNAKTLFHI